jgi:hypothetical protein
MTCLEINPPLLQTIGYPSPRQWHIFVVLACNTRVKHWGKWLTARLSTETFISFLNMSFDQRRCIVTTTCSSNNKNLRIPELRKQTSLCFETDDIQYIQNSLTITHTDIFKLVRQMINYVEDCLCLKYIFPPFQWIKLYIFLKSQAKLSLIKLF